MAKITYNKTVQLPQKLRFHLTQNTWDKVIHKLGYEIMKITNFREYLYGRTDGLGIYFSYMDNITVSYIGCQVFTDIMTGKRSSGKVVLTLVGLKVQ